MPTTISNRASIAYNYGTSLTGVAVSNLATTELPDAITVSKTPLASSYRADGNLVFVLSMLNTTSGALSNLTVNDNLGATTVGTATVLPYTYVGPSLLYVNGVMSSITPTVADTGITYTVPSVPAGGNAQIIYTVSPNTYTPLTTGSSVTNTATFNSADLADPVTATATLPVDTYADVRIVKNMDSLNASQVVYRFDISNYGNDAATEIVLTDTFTPAPASVTVSVNGVTLDTSYYTYTGGVLTLPSGSTYQMSLDAATITQDTTTGVVTVTPTTDTVLVTGSF